MPTRALIIQQEPVHEDVVNSVRYVLRANGVSTRIVLDRGIAARGDLFGAFTNFASEVTYSAISGTDEGWPEVAQLAKDVDLVVFNTFQLNGHARWVRRLGKPAIGIVHNPRLLVDSQECVELVREGGIVLATLAPHATADLMAHDPVLFEDTATLGLWMFPVAEQVSPTPERRTRFTVPGAVDFRNRDYYAVLDLIGELADGYGPDRFEIAFLGGGQDNAALRALVTERGLDSVATFAPIDPACGQVLSEVLYPELARSSFLLPLLPPDRVDYRRWKISTAVSASIGFGIPALLDRWTATVYDIPHIPTALGAETAAVRAALAMPEIDVAELRRGLVGVRTRMQDRAVGEMSVLLEALGRAGTGKAARRVGANDRSAFLDFARRALPHSYAQRFQDLFALWQSGGACDGWFVEFGAVSGVGQSNTYLLERLGWDGVVAEPHPAHANDLRRNRVCAVSTKCVLDATGDTVKFHAVVDRPALSTVAGHGEDDMHADRRADHVEHRVETITLTDLLAEAGAPPVIDFLSIDTEGSELRILQAHDFSRYTFRCIVVEHNDVHRKALWDLLTSKGFRRLWPDLSGHDDWYVLPDAYPAWTRDGIEEALGLVAQVEPFAAGYDDRVRTMKSWVPREVAIPALPGPPGRPYDAGAIAQLVRRLAAEVPAQNGQPAPLRRRRLRRLFAEFVRTLEVDGLLVVADGSAHPPTVDVARTLSLDASELSASRALSRVGDLERAAVWSEVDDVRLLIANTGALWRHVCVVVVDAPLSPGPREWGEPQAVRELADRGFVLVARARRPNGRVGLLLIDSAMCARPSVARALAEAWALRRHESPPGQVATAPQIAADRPGSELRAVARGGAARLRRLKRQMLDIGRDRLGRIDL